MSLKSICLIKAFVTPTLRKSIGVGGRALITICNVCNSWFYFFAALFDAITTKCIDLVISCGWWCSVLIVVPCRNPQAMTKLTQTPGKHTDTAYSRSKNIWQRQRRYGMPVVFVPLFLKAFLITYNRSFVGTFCCRYVRIYSLDAFILSGNWNFLESTGP